MPSAYLLSLRPDVLVVGLEPAPVAAGAAPGIGAGSQGGIMLEAGQTRLTLGQVPGGVRRALTTLQQGGATEEELGHLAAAEGYGALPLFYLTMHRLGAAGMLCYTVVQDGDPIATLVPLSARHRCAPAPPPSGVCSLSRFALLRRRDRQLVIETPLAPAQVTLHTPQAALVPALLAAPHTTQTLAQAAPDLREETVLHLLGLLAGAGMLAEHAENGACREDTEAPWLWWEPHDLLMHSRSRLGRHNNPYGGTYRFEATIPPLPLVKPAMSDQVLELEKPDLDRLRRDDPPFADVVESRRSMRHFGAEPITAGQLGEFLYRTARLKGRLPSEHGELGSRPYPAGGALYELELYPVIERCAGLDPGLYHYQSERHALCRLPADADLVRGLLDQAWYTVARQSRPQVLIVVTARFGRVAWKYQSLVYALVLKHVGVLYQTMYLTATAMGIAACGLGGGDSDLFAAASGLDYLEESSVGEFLLASAGAGPEGAAGEATWREGLQGEMR